MPQDATCPKCSHTFPITEARGAYTVACPRCEAELTAEFLKPSAPPEAGQPPYDLKVKAGALPGTTAPPPPRKKKDEDDEPKRSGGSAMVVLLSGGLGLLFVLGGLSVTGWYLFTQIDFETPTARNSSSSSNNNNRNTQTPPNNSRPNPVVPKGNNPTPPFPKTNPTPGLPPDPEPKQKRDTFDLRPVIVPGLPPLQPVNIDPTFVASVDFGGNVGAVAVGGGGRYIVFHIQNTGKLVVFDSNSGGLLTQTADVGIGDVKLAAGGTRLVATVGNGKKLRVFALPDMKQMGADIDSPLFHHVQALAMGSRTNGPLLVADPFGEVVLMDVIGGKPIEGSHQKLGVQHTEHIDLYRAAPDGRTFLLGDSFKPDAPFKVLTEVANKWKLQETGVTCAYPGPDGKRMYGKDQIVETTGRTVANKPETVSGGVWYVPALTVGGSNMFLRVNEKVVGGRTGVWLSVHTGTNVTIPTRTAWWEGQNDMAGLLGAGGVQTQLDQHLFLVPESKLLVVLSRDKTKLAVRKINI